MCIFTLPVLSVGDTRIFARFSGAGTQFLAYQMTYESEQENAMILPIPVRQPAKEDSVRFIDLEAYDDLLDVLDDGFPIKPRVSLGCGGMKFTATNDSALKVVEVGNYIASFIPTLGDFDRLEARFRLPKDVWDQIPQYEDYGFVVFQLKEGNQKPHPMAFEFETRDEQELFFPTVHIHDGEVHDKEYFHHLLYMQHAGFDSRVGDYINADVPDRATGVIRSDKVAGEFCKTEKTDGVVLDDLLVHRKIVEGNLKNVDYRIMTAGHPTKPSFNWRPVQRWWPWAAIVAGMAWFFARRGKLNSRKMAENKDVG